jgi:hypothetical protein
MPDLSHSVGEWNSQLAQLFKCITYNSTIFCDYIMLNLVENFCAQSRRRTLKNIFVHLDNACLHNSRQSCEYLEGFRARKIPHPAYSPDLDLSYFFLFGYLKIKLATTVIRSREKLISIIW